MIVGGLYLLTLSTVYITLLCSDGILTMEYKTVLASNGARAIITESCSYCYGLGYIVPGHYEECEECGGSGEIIVQRYVPSIRHRDIQGVVEA